MAVRVLAPVPPLATGKTPETSEDERMMAELNKAPPAVERTGKAELREAMVAEADI